MINKPDDMFIMENDNFFIYGKLAHNNDPLIVLDFINEKKVTLTKKEALTLVALLIDLVNK